MMLLGWMMKDYYSKLKKRAGHRTIIGRTNLPIQEGREPRIRRSMAECINLQTLGLCLISVALLLFPGLRLAYCPIKCKQRRCFKLSYSDYNTLTLHCRVYATVYSYSLVVQVP